MSENIKNNNVVTAAGIDIGSNSLRMLIGKVKDGKITEMLASDRATTRLASGIATSGRLCDASIEASINALKRFREALDKFQVKKIKAFATSAVREAKNGNDFIFSVKNLGLPVEIITGEEEANTVFTGVNTGLDTGQAPLIFDTGGGSTEFIAARDKKVIFAESYKIGVVKLVDRFDMRDDAAKNIEPCAAFVSDFLKNVQLPHDNKMLIATAGTATTIAAIDMGMSEYDWRKVNGYTVSKDKIETLLKTITSLPYEKRAEIVGMEKGREDLVIPGMIIMLEVMKKSGFNSLTVSDFGLREGALVAAANS